MRTKQLEILLVEDSQSDAHLTIMALEEAKLASNIIHLKDGTEALDYIFCTGSFANNKPPTNIGLILLDIKMPKVDGIEVLRKIKSDSNTKKIPVAMFTSSQEERDVKECYLLGVNSFIVKPLDFDLFSNTVKDAGTYWLTINHLSENKL